MIYFISRHLTGIKEKRLPRPERLKLQLLYLKIPKPIFRDLRIRLEAKLHIKARRYLVFLKKSKV